MLAFELAENSEDIIAFFERFIEMKLEAGRVFEFNAFDHHTNNFLPTVVEGADHIMSVVLVAEDGDIDIGIAQIGCTFNAGDGKSGGVEIGSGKVPVKIFSNFAFK